MLKIKDIERIYRLYNYKLLCKQEKKKCRGVCVVLRIKDNVDLKELEKFGFVPRYSTDTGELVEYFRVRELPNGYWTRCFGKCGITLRKQENKTIMKIFRCFKPTRKKHWVIDNNDMFERFDTDTLYDLIQAGYVEKYKEQERLVKIITQMSRSDKQWKKIKQQ